LLFILFKLSEGLWYHSFSHLRYHHYVISVKHKNIIKLLVLKVASFPILIYVNHLRPPNPSSSNEKVELLIVFHLVLSKSLLSFWFPLNTTSSAFLVRTESNIFQAITFEASHLGATGAFGSVGFVLGLIVFIADRRRQDDQSNVNNTKKWKKL